MTLLFTKQFPFSASYARGEKVLGRNFVLEAALEAPADEEAETRFVETVERELVSKIESRDLGIHVDFLKGTSIDDRSLLAAFWPIVERAAAPARLRSLSLERDSRTRTTLSL